MKLFSLLAATLALSVLALGCAAAMQPHRMPLGIATIVDSGSTNSSGFTVKVYAGGKSTIAMKRPVATRTASVARTAASDLFAAIHASQSGSRPSGGAMCMKSASFGSTLRVQYANWTSVDLNCPVVGANAVLKTRVDAVLAALKVRGSMTGGRTITLPTNEPRRMEPSAIPIGSAPPLATPSPASTPR